MCGFPAHHNTDTLSVALASPVLITIGRGNHGNAEALHAVALVRAEAGEADHRPRPNDVLVVCVVDFQVVYLTEDSD